MANSSKGAVSLFCRDVQRVNGLGKRGSAALGAVPESDGVVNTGNASRGCASACGLSDQLSRSDRVSSLNGSDSGFGGSWVGPQSALELASQLAS